MEFKQVFISKETNYKKEEIYRATGSIFVEGLGEVSIKECLSIETMLQVEREVIFALRHKLGLICVAEREQVPTEESNEKD